MDAASGAVGRLRKSWSVASEIDWGRIDLSAARSDAGLLMMVRRAALRAARRTVGLSQLVATFAADARLSALLARELHDSWKHFHALRSYLDVVEHAPALSEAEVDQHRRGPAETALRRPEEAGARISVLVDEASRDSAIFGLISAQSADPALGRLADRIAEDRQRHSLALAGFLSREVPGESAKTA